MPAPVANGEIASSSHLEKNSVVIGQVHGSESTGKIVESGPVLRKSHFAFLTLPQYSMIALSNAVEPLRMANSISGQVAYEWSIVSLDGAPVTASNGLALAPTQSLESLGRVEIL